MSESVSGTVASNASTIQTTISGRGGGRSQVPGRGNQTARNRNNRNNRNKQTLNNNGNVSYRPGLFKGNTADMNGHVFECYEECGDRTQFPKTLEALNEYASKNLKFPEDLRSIFDEVMSTPSIAVQADIPDTATKREVFLWETSLKSYTRRSEELTSNLTNLYAVIWGQCSEAMRNKLRALADFPTKNKANDCIWLLGEI
jgi:hypothetical protein